MTDEVQTEEAAAPAPVEKDIQNGVTRPKDGTKTGFVWTVADRISGEQNRPAFRKEVIEACVAEEEINPSTAATQYGRWRKYHGLAGKGHAEETPAEEAVVEDDVVEDDAE